jgi:hypothetical protein
LHCDFLPLGQSHWQVCTGRPMTLNALNGQMNAR